MATKRSLTFVETSPQRRTDVLKKENVGVYKQSTSIYPWFTVVDRTSLSKADKADKTLKKRANCQREEEKVEEGGGFNND